MEKLHFTQKSYILDRFYKLIEVLFNPILSKTDIENIGWNIVKENNDLDFYILPNKLKNNLISNSDSIVNRSYWNSYSLQHDKKSNAIRISGCKDNDTYRATLFQGFCKRNELEKIMKQVGIK